MTCKQEFDTEKYYEQWYKMFENIKNTIGIEDNLTDEEVFNFTEGLLIEHERINKCIENGTATYAFEIFDNKAFQPFIPCTVRYFEYYRPINIVKRLGLKQINDPIEIANICDKIIAENPNIVNQYKSGNTNIINKLKGILFSKENKEQPNPSLVISILDDRLKRA